MSVSEPLLLSRKKPTSVVDVGTFVSYLWWDLLSSSSKLSDYCIIFVALDWTIIIMLLHFPLSIIIWEDHKLFQFNQSQPSYSSLYYIVNLFFWQGYIVLAYTVKN